MFLTFEIYRADTPDIEANSSRVSPYSRPGKLAESENCFNVDNCLSLALEDIISSACRANSARTKSDMFFLWQIYHQAKVIYP